MHVLFIQYTNPAAYPPLINASRLLYNRGVDCHFFGIDRRPELQFTREEEWRSVRYWKARKSGPLEWISYTLFVLTAITRGCARGAKWIYCSDSPIAPAGLALALLGKKVIYHEHDAPSDNAHSKRSRLILACRKALVRRATCVVPSPGRAQILKNLGAQQVLIVPNCPSLHELNSCKAEIAEAKNPIRLLFQGSIGPDRLPSTVIQAIANLPAGLRPTLDIVGYEIPSGEGHIAALQALASRLGIPQHVNYIGTLPRNEMLRKGTGALMGLSFMPMASENVNMNSMAGASNKPFDYLCQSVVPICSDLPPWREFFGDSAMYCDPRSPDSMRSTLRRAIEEIDRTRSQGRAGQSRIQDKWNYDTAFAPVLRIITSSNSDRSQRTN